MSDPPRATDYTQYNTAIQSIQFSMGWVWLRKVQCGGLWRGKLHRMSLEWERLELENINKLFADN